MNKEEIKMKEYSEEEKEKMNHTMYNLEYCLEGWKKINNSINNIDMECIKEILYKQSWLDHMECQLYYYKDELDKALEEKVELKSDLLECLYIIKKEISRTTDNGTRKELNEMYELLGKWDK